MYSVEFTLHTYNASAQAIRNALLEFGAGLLISESQECREKGQEFQISLNTEEPETVFDLCAQFGRIKSVRIDEMKAEGANG